MPTDRRRTSEYMAGRRPVDKVWSKKDNKKWGPLQTPYTVMIQMNFKGKGRESL